MIGGDQVHASRVLLLNREWGNGKHHEDQAWKEHMNSWYAHSDAFTCMHSLCPQSKPNQQSYTAMATRNFSYLPYAQKIFERH